MTMFAMANTKEEGSPVFHAHLLKSHDKISGQYLRFNGNQTLSAFSFLKILIATLNLIDLGPVTFQLQEIETTVATFSRMSFNIRI